ncbi:MAG: uracil phosphoribosyltransferase [Patescibacteria group bacterium]
MLITSEILPLDIVYLQEIQAFCLKARELRRLVVYGGVPSLLSYDYLNQTLPLPDRAIRHINVSAEEWRETLKDACSKVASVFRSHDLSNAAVYYLWRAGLAFSFGFQEIGIDNHFHFGLRRNEKRPEETEEIYLPLDLDRDQLNRFSHHIIADVMLATGGSFDTIIRRLLASGVREKQITLVCLISAPEGIYNLLKEYPQITIVAGALDDHLDRNGYIDPGLGDAGDLTFEDLQIKWFDPVERLFKGKEWDLLKQKIHQANPAYQFNQ